MREMSAPVMALLVPLCSLHIHEQHTLYCWELLFQCHLLRSASDHLKKHASRHSVYLLCFQYF